MSNYTPYYEGGWKNEEEMTTTPICAEALNHMEEGISAAYDTDIGLYPTETASGDVAVIHDGAESIPVRDLSVAIEPAQSLNGYERPWAGGAGKNKLENTAVTTTKQGLTYTVNADGTISVSGTATANSYLHIATSLTFPEAVVVNGVPTPVASGVNIQVVAGGTYYNDTGDGVTIPANTTITEVRMRINNEITVNKVVFKPMIRLASETDPTFEPYSNICPISGWSAVKVARTAQNLLPKDYTETVFSRNGLTFTVNADGSLTANGTATAPTYFNYSGWEYDTLPFMHRPGLRLRLSGSYPGAMTRLQTRPSGSSTTTTIATDTGAGAEFTVPDDVMAYALFINVTTGQTLTNATFYPVISLADEGQLTWSPSEAEVEDITLPTTVYGGTLDVTKGILTVDRAMVDLGTLTWNYSSGSNFNLRSTNAIGALPPITLSTTPRAISSIYPALSYAETSDTDKSLTIVFATSAQAGKVWVHDSSYTDAQTFKTAVSGQTLVYELATPITYTLTPVQVKTLLGENRIYADAGQVTVQYRADFNEAGLMYIPKAPTADGSYRLTADVNGGTPTYRWEAAE